MIDRLAQTIKFNELRKGQDFNDYLGDLLSRIENEVYAEITKRVNYLIASKFDIEAHTADDSILQNESGSVHTNLGATGTVTLTLPSAPAKGTNYKFCVQAAQELRIDPGSAAIRDDCGQTADKYKTANAVGECIELVADAGGNWETVSKYGTWTEEL